MPRVSKRGDQLIQSPIRSLVPYAREARRKGKHIFYLNIGQPDIETPTLAIESLKNYDQSIIKYGPSEGQYELRDTVARYYESLGLPIDYQDVLVTTGASEAILFALFSSFDAGEEIIIPEPFYANYIGFAQVWGIRMVPITSYIDNGFALPSMGEFEAKITGQTKAIFLCNPGNPAGNLYNEKELKELAKLVKDKDLFLIIDEVYREFCYDEKFTSVLALEGLEENVLVIDSISKVFSACGTRIGFLVTRNEELRHALVKFAELRLCPPRIGQVIAEACYCNRAEYISKVKEEYNQRRHYLYDRLSKMHGVKCYLPKAAFYIMTELPVDDAEKFCQWLLTDFDLDGNTVMMAPGDGFYIHKEAGKRQVRIAFILNVKKLEKAMDCLEQGLVEYQKVMAGSELVAV